MVTEPFPVPNTTTPDPRGSLLLGVIWAWSMLFGGYFVVALGIVAIVNGFGSVGNAVAVLAGLLPWLGQIALIVWFAARGRPRTAVGVAIGIASIFALGLLLVAACFGLFAGGWH